MKNYEEKIHRSIRKGKNRYENNNSSEDHYR